MWLYKNFAIASLVLFLAGCGFSPIYGGKFGGALTIDLSRIKIEPIKDWAGQMLRNELEQKINPLGVKQKKLFRLNVTLSESKQELAIKKSEIATRANLKLTALYILTSQKSGVTVTSGSSSIIVGYNILTQEFATLIAEKDARKRAAKELSTDITNRLAVHFQLNQRKAAAVK